MWKVLRIFILLLILGTAVQQTFLDQADLDWEDNFYVALYPINADGSEAAARYIESLTKAQFNNVEAFFAEEAERYGLNMRRPIAVESGE